VTQERIDLLKSAGCFQIGIGIESGDDKIREDMLNKNLKQKDILTASRILHQNKIKFHTFNMFCLPGEGLKSAFKTLDFNLRIKPDFAWSSIFQPYPGTKFFSEEVKYKIINKNFNRFRVNYAYNKDFKKIERLQKLFMLTIKFPLLRYILPFLIRLPLDGIYDNISKKTWHMLYGKNLGK
jgi:radical SAM superfamily enzyme YgiQ (UPF0313 family)